VLISLKYIKIFKGTPTCFSPTHFSTRVTTHTSYTYCCHNAGVDRRDFKFSVLNLKKNL